VEKATDTSDAVSTPELAKRFNPVDPPGSKAAVAPVR